jgi:phenylpyruvate tautomerase PptA (4-oxalocrotonate tautomerase family)
MSDHESRVSGAGVSRRAILQTATVAAGVALGASTARAQTSAAPGYGAPLVEVCVPHGVLTSEQKSAMIKGITDVLRRVTPSQGPLFVEIIETAEGGFGVNGNVFVLKAR